MLSARDRAIFGLEDDDFTCKHACVGFDWYGEEYFYCGAIREASAKLAPPVPKDRLLKVDTYDDMPF